jgi:DNA-directed RNA polymerase II subunit RPB2
LDQAKYASYVDLFIPSVHQAGRVFNQEVALKYIATFTKGKTIPHALEIITNYLLPHVGEMNFSDKAYFIGYMVHQLLKVYTKETKATDRDNFRFKRIELTGSLLYDLFKEYYSKQQHDIFQKFDTEFYYDKKSNKNIYSRDFPSLITANYKEFFSERMVAEGFRKAFKGNWGSEAHTKRIGVVQDLNRLSFNSALSQLRKINLPLDASAKVVGPRLSHATQWGMIDTIDTPDGGNVGLHKHLTMLARVTRGYSGYPLMKWLRKNTDLLLLAECTPRILSKLCKIIVNGRWIGVISDPRVTETKLKQLRRIAVIPTFTSIYWNIQQNTLYLYTDAGRICRPIFYTEQQQQTSRTAAKMPSYANEAILEKIFANKFTWEQLITGFASKKDENFNLNACRIYDTIADLYNVTDLKALRSAQAILDYIDTSETEGSLIAMDYETAHLNDKPYTHVEIHPSIMLGVMGNQVIFPENNQLPRDLFACGQAKQAVSLYHSNYPVRVDKTGIVLNNGQIPLIKSRYLKHINNEEHPCGENTIVAIMSFNGYNVEDSILFNEGAVKRGLFRTTYFSVYEDHEESSKIGKNTTDSHFTNIENRNVVGMKPGCDYSTLNEYGLIKENTYVNDKSVLIGKVTTNPDNADNFLDASSLPKKGQSGYVDKSFMTEGEEGFRIAKVRVRSERIPALGDKFGSRCGQKGTVGLIIPEADMPFTANGLKPDIIINPHAIPSRMTIGQLVESLMGKACVLHGAFGDCTAFVNKGDMPKVFGKLLTANGYHSSGTDILYNGQTGEQVETEIYMGPTYYMRLKHMTKDKINYRALGPRTVLTRQTVQGRANDGGLRIGEMERDGLISHGITTFLQESMLIRGDEYYMAICNKTGTIAIYNENQNLFLSPLADGPIKFSGTIGEHLKIQTMSKYGRSFSIIRIPYAFKLLMHELLTMNVQMRLITEDNIDQMTNMSFSDNIQKLTGKTVNIKEFNLQVPPNMRQPLGQPKKSLAALGFKKLAAPPFKKWRVSMIPDPIQVTDLMPLPSDDSLEMIGLEPAQENSWFALRKAIDAAKTKLDIIPEETFYQINSRLDLYASLKRLVQKTYNMEHATNAALKMYELIYQMNLLTNLETETCLPTVNAFCNAELPGAFIIAINHYMKTRCLESTFDWIASSYLPDAARLVGNETVLDDKYKIYAKNRSHWLMGPMPNALPPGENILSGDVTDPVVVNALGNATHQRFREKDGATIYTSDVGTSIATAELNRQEELTSNLNYGQVLTGLLALAIGGSLVTKQFTFVTPFSRSLIALVASLFEETYITKPSTSRPGNSEIYLVAKGFKGISADLSTALLDRCEAYKNLDKMPSTWGSLIEPAILAQVDGDLLAIAQELHGEQQVAFLNEMSDAYRVFATLNDRDIKELVRKEEQNAQTKWLAENPLLVISTDQNLNNAVADETALSQVRQAILSEEPTNYAESEGEGMQGEGMQGEGMQGEGMQGEGMQGEGADESILIPAEKTEEEIAEESEEAAGEGTGEKKTIKFNL